ncbi:hypothetical protein [Niallia taxi]|uniref:hypothetical protein n=1 Tax=Niallia taxi TaxID=2499688 RepID=UPI00300A5EBF
MHNMFVTAVRLKFMDINAVPEAFRPDVKKELGIEDPVIEQPVETVIETPVEQPVEESPVEETPEEPTPAEEPA